jgi:cation-transporting ATPase 13A1
MTKADSLPPAGYVVYYGRHSETLTSFRLIITILLILTSTIPPDLPVQLNFSVNTSVSALLKVKVFCTEPFRIPFAGMIAVCCFDKTGTLTAEEYRLVGVDDGVGGTPSPRHAEIVGNYERDPEKIPIHGLQVIGGCHSLVRGAYGHLVGDSLEATAFTSARFTLSTEGVSVQARCSLRALKTYHFSSELRRMTTVCDVDGCTLVLMKGAADEVAKYFEDPPGEDYFETNRRYTCQGCRVLALAWRDLAGTQLTKDSPRELIERNMAFAGFLIFSADLKRGTEDTIVQLLTSTHRCIIITGDDPLTACHVAKRLHIINKRPAIHDMSVTDENGEPVSDDDDRALCYTGRALNALAGGDQSEYDEVLRNCNVFARMAPNDKAQVVLRLGSLGYETLMCGDGTNDVGALKQANVGVGLVEQPAQTEVDGLGEYKPKLGAASIASPFVSKRPTISACVDLIRFGRSTLSSTLDLFKQLSLNCLISAYTLSVLFVENIRFGDRQMMIFSLVIQVAAFSISWAVPTRKLSQERPFPGQFNAYLVTSVLLQFGIHFFFLHKTHQLVFATGYKLD